MKLVRESLNESLDSRYKKDELIDKIMQTVYADDDAAKDMDNERYLESLTIAQLQEMLDDFEGMEDDVYGEDDEDEDYERSYSEAYYNMDKYMDDTEGVVDAFYELIDKGMDENEKIDVIGEYIEANCADEEKMYSYFPEGGDVYGFAAHLLDQMEDNNDEDGDEDNEDSYGTDEEGNINY